MLKLSTYGQPDRELPALYAAQLKQHVKAKRVAESEMSDLDRIIQRAMQAERWTNNIVSLDWAD